MSLLPRLERQVMFREEATMMMQPVLKYDGDRYPSLKGHYEMKGQSLGALVLATMAAALALLMQGCHGPS